MNAPTEKAWFLDVAHTCDEVLVLFVQEAGSRAARDELTGRHWRKFNARLFRGRGRQRLGASDLDDAQQQAFFWIQEAIDAFDPVQLSLPNGTCFHTFLQRILRWRLSDFCRSLQRRNRRFRLAGAQDRWLHHSLTDQGVDSPGQQAELRRHLDAVEGLLDPQTRPLWNELRQGKRLRDLPQVLGVSYRTVKRRWRSLREQIVFILQQLDQEVRKPIDR
jgi:DNA-directed RNA polymerase specialized sigma24 family protein